MAHYIGLAGLYGCLPQTCAAYDSYADAVESLADLHELGSQRRAELKRNGYIDLNLRRDGNEYAEVKECECPTRDTHSDV